MFESALYSIRVSDRESFVYVESANISVRNGSLVVTRENPDTSLMQSVDIENLVTTLSTGIR